MGTMMEQLQEKGIRVVDGAQSQARIKGQTSKSQVKAGFNFKVPTIPKVATSVVTELEQNERRQAFENFQAEARPAIGDYIGRLRTIDAMPRDEQELYRDDATALRTAVVEMLGYPEPYRSVVVLAYADAVVQTCPERRGQVTESLERLVNVGLIETVLEAKSNKRNSFRIYGTDYSLTPQFAKNEEAQGVVKHLKDLVTRQVAAAKERIQGEQATLEAAVGLDRLTVEQILAGEIGDGLIRIPDGARPDGSKLFGGTVHVRTEIQEGQVRISILEGIAGVQRIARDLNERGRWLGVWQLTQERVNSGSGEVLSDLRVMHAILRRGVLAVLDKAKREADEAERQVAVANEQNELKAKANLSSVEFFLKGETGVVYCDYGQTFEQKVRGDDNRPTGEVRKHDGVHYLVERDERGRIRLEAPERLKKFFAGSQDWNSPGEKFGEIPFPGNVLLRTEYAKASDKARKAAQKTS